MVQIGILGPLDVRTDHGVVVDVAGVRLRGLLVALAFAPGRVVSRSALVDWIWGERPPVDAANALQRLVSRLRKTLGPDVVLGEAGGYRLAVNADAVDAARFENLVGQARAEDGPRRVRLLREALGLWRGPACADVGLRDTAALDAAVTRLEGLRLTATEDRFEAEVGLGDAAGVVTELTDLVAAHPLRERFVGALMRALTAAGRDNEALLVYQRTRDALADALGTDPSPELSALHTALLRGETGRDERPTTNLRSVLTSFVGRTADVEALASFVTQNRLTTLVGPGGSGKTRLATETARTLLEDVPDGVWLVELATVEPDGDPARLALTAIGLRDALLAGTPNGSDPAERLITAIRDRDTLLVLDNCEHVVDEAAAFADRVLGECPRLRVLATSREPLGITGEALWTVEPLDPPPGDATPDQIRSSPAVQLLRDRAAAVRRNLTIDDATLSTMARVCRSLDGMPLAIELAAARLRTMPLDQLANRLDDRFRLLTTGSRTAMPRHQTLRAVVDWSWELLDDAERRVLRRLSVFAGGAGLDGAERVCAGDGVGQEDVFPLISSLVEKSLVVAADDGSPRYRMLTTIRDYAARRLAEAEETVRTRRAHLAYFVERVEAAEPYLRRAEQVEWLAALEPEHDNISAALRGALAAGEAQSAMRLAAAAGWYWWLSGRRGEGVELLVAAANLPGEVDDDARAMVYGMVVMFVTSSRGDIHLGAEWIHKAHRFSQRSDHRVPLLDLVIPLERMLTAPDTVIPAFESLLDSEDPWVRALARWQVGKMSIRGGRGGQDAETQLVTALAEFQALGDRFGTSLVLAQLGELIAMRGEFANACEHVAQAIAAIAEVGATEDVIHLSTLLARLHWLDGDPVASASALGEAERLAEGVAWPYALAELAFARAELSRLRGDVGTAREQLGIAATLLEDHAEQAETRAEINDMVGYLAEDLPDARGHRVVAWQAATETGEPYFLARVLVGVADLAVRLDQPEQAARLLAASTAVRGMADLSSPDAVRIEKEVRGRLGAARFTEISRQGARADWSQLAEATLSS
ncbi:winged helix-turn-helix domain-containing protein [Spiractinospora alimapuensis]|uniref:BTAD domain-containing putative transcriptional regulator n=1 Tax=Spiractinospora alimapuensis TaxID=2820884 RepID=UPI001F38ED06|nr:BTAD domain-containing putative transcriptional regulator [Spiractinospora alimapuensis]QVQ54477.1 winged helix-turn-helix domain-containing protein [Spiractinospora alimapuensis]